MVKLTEVILTATANEVTDTRDNAAVGAVFSAKPPITRETHSGANQNTAFLPQIAKLTS